MIRLLFFAALRCRHAADYAADDYHDAMMLPYDS